MCNFIIFYRGSGKWTKVIFLLQSLDLGLIDQRRPLIWLSQSQEKFLIRFSDQPYFQPFKTAFPILSHVFLSCLILSSSNLCRIRRLFYLRLHVFCSAKKENKLIGLSIVGVGHVERWPYFQPFKTIGVVVHTYKNGLTFERPDRFTSYLEGSCTRVSRFTSYAYVMIRPTQLAQPAYQPKSEKRA